MLNVAVLPESVPDPRSVAPSKKLTVPAGAPAVDVSVAVNVTD